MTPAEKTSVWLNVHSRMVEEFQKTIFEPTGFRLEEADLSWKMDWDLILSSLEEIGEIVPRWEKGEEVELLEELESYHRVPYQAASILYSCFQPYWKWLGFALALKMVYGEWVEAAILSLLCRDLEAQAYISEQTPEDLNPFEQVFWEAFVDRRTVHSISSGHPEWVEAWNRNFPDENSDGIEFLERIAAGEPWQSYNNGTVYSFFPLSNGMAFLLKEKGLDLELIGSEFQGFFGLAIESEKRTRIWEQLNPSLK